MRTEQLSQITVLRVEKSAAGRGSPYRRRPMEGTMGYEEAKQRGRGAMALLAECCERNDEKSAYSLTSDRQTGQ
jgi:hypothetical protein